MENRFSYLAQAVYYPIPGKDKEFIALWKEGPCRLSEEMGGVNVGIYYNSQRGEYIATSHWTSKERFEKYSQSAQLSRFMETISHICQKPAFRDLYTVIEEVA